MFAYAGSIAVVDLKQKKVTDYTVSQETLKKYLGGKGLATKILYDLLPPKTLPFSSENILVISTGAMALTGAPSSGRFNISTISPLTGLCVSSNCGGSFGYNLKKCGFDALIIKEKSDSPIYLDISDNEIQFKDAAHLMGKTTSETQAILKKPSAVIGPAGENKVLYACVMSGERAAGRGGVGAVFGDKNLKGLCAKGTQKPKLYDPKKFEQLNQKWMQKLKNHYMTGHRCPELGTSMLLKPMNKNGQLATKNFAYGSFKNYHKISGEMLKEKYTIKNSGCITCPIRCSRVVKFEDKEIKGPELETLGLLGANLLNDDLELIIRLNHIMDELGMDTMSCGGSLGFAMELRERELADLGLAFGELSGIEQIVTDIAYRRGNGDILADGVARMAARFGAMDAAIHVKGMELAAYEPRGAYGQGLTYASANRGGCHLNGGYLILLEGLGLCMNPKSIKSKASLAVMFQNLMEGVSCLGFCLFTTYAVFPSILYKGGVVAKMISKVFAISAPFVNFMVKYPKLLPINIGLIPHTKAFALATGFKMNVGALLRAGENVYDLERRLNLRQGLNPLQDTLPKRLLTKREDGRAVPVNKLLKKYYKIRRWKKKGLIQIEL